MDQKNFFPRSLSHADPGISQRDYIATQLMPFMLSHHDFKVEKAAIEAYKAADTLIIMGKAVNGQNEWQDNWPFPSLNVEHFKDSTPPRLKVNGIPVLESEAIEIIRRKIQNYNKSLDFFDRIKAENKATSTQSPDTGLSS